ncbi:MAG: phosphoglycerate mutase family protein [Saprospiraceae bacterium]|nr:phosphoglycerate mutase family protein [Saprospiraceae bacterium]
MLKTSVLIILLTGLVAPTTGCAQESADATVYYVLRHAEKAEPPADAPGDPHLSVKGHARAAQLAKLLEHASLTDIFSSEYRRTQETVAPLAGQQGLSVQSYNPADLQDFAGHLTQQSGRILVVGHSNTTPELVRLLGGEPGEPIDDATEFDRLYILYRPADGQVTTVRLHYGG